MSALVAAGVAMAASQAISHVWDRPRPFATHEAATHLLSAPSPDPSFPSDHAAAAFAIAFCVFAFSRWAGAGFLAAATLIGLSRLALGQHYPSDVVAGMAVGFASAMLVVHLGQAWIRRLATIVGRVSDPVVAPAWRAVVDRLPARLRRTRPV